VCTGAGGCALCARGAGGRGERVLCAEGRGGSPLLLGVLEVMPCMLLCCWRPWRMYTMCWSC
jgi:hypothetical protein